MPKVNIKPHGIALYSVQSTIARGLLHSKLKRLQEGCRELSALFWPFPQPLSQRVQLSAPDLFGFLQEEVAEQIVSSSRLTTRMDFFSFPLPATSFPELVLPPEIAECPTLPTPKSKLKVSFLHLLEENTAFVGKYLIWPQPQQKSCDRKSVDLGLESLGFMFECHHSPAYIMDDLSSVKMRLRSPTVQCYYE